MRVLEQRLDENEGSAPHSRHSNGRWMGSSMTLVVPQACSTGRVASVKRRMSEMRASTARSMYSEIGTKLVLHNEADAPFECLGLVDSFDGCDILQTCDYIKLSTESYVRCLLKTHG